MKTTRATTTTRAILTVALPLPDSCSFCQNPSLKENLSKLKKMEQKLRENPNVKENLTKLKEAEQKFRDNPSVKENLSKLKEAEKKFREDAKNKQVQYHIESYR